MFSSMNEKLGCLFALYHQKEATNFFEWPIPLQHKKEQVDVFLKEPKARSFVHT